MGSKREPDPLAGCRSQEEQETCSIFSSTGHPALEPNPWPRGRSLADRSPASEDKEVSGEASPGQLEDTHGVPWAVQGSGPNNLK